MTDIDRATLPSQLLEQASRRPQIPALRTKHLGAWFSWRWEQVAERVRTIATHLGERGFAEGDVLLVAGAPSERALFVSLAAQWRGGVAAPIEPGLGEEALARVVGYLSPRLAFVDNDDTLDRLLALGVNVIDGNPRGLRDHPDPAVVDYRWLVADAQGGEPGGPLARAAHAAFAFVDLRATGELVVHELSHAALLEEGRTVVAQEKLDVFDEAFAARAFAASAQARYLIAPWLLAGFSLHFPETLATRDNDRREIAPTLVTGTRETYARVAAWVDERLPVRGTWRRALFDSVLTAQAGPLTRTLAWWLIGRPLREVIGFSRVRVSLVAGPPLDDTSAALFAALRIDVHAWADATEWRLIAQGDRVRAAVTSPQSASSQGLTPASIQTSIQTSAQTSIHTEAPTPSHPSQPSTQPSTRLPAY